MTILDQIPFQIDVAALFARMRLDPEGEYSGEVRALAEKAGAVARPKAILDDLFVEDRFADGVVAGGVRFTSRVLRQNLDSVHRVIPYVATCGAEIDSVPVAADDFVGQFSRDAIKEMALNAARNFLADHVRRTCGFPRMASMNPGSGDQDIWPIEQQKELFSVFGNVRELIGVTLTDTFLMLPNKSVSGLFYPTEVDFVTCQLCHREGCPNRRAPFDAHQWEMRFAAAK